MKKTTLSLCVSSFALMACNDLNEVPELPNPSSSSQSVSSSVELSSSIPISSSSMIPLSSVISSSTEISSSSSLVISSSSSTPVLSSSVATIQYSQMSDPRNGKVYKTVIINGKEWTVDNLSFQPPSGDGALCPAGKPTSFCDSLGYFYDWQTATGGKNSNTIPSAVQGVCPTGWHIPSDAEFLVLQQVAGDSVVAGYNLKAKSGWDLGSGSDLLGFGALPAGYIDIDTAYYGQGSYAYFWSTTEVDKLNAHIWYLGKKNKAIFNQDNFKDVHASVRCLRDY